MTTLPTVRIPRLADAVEVPWDKKMARSQAIYGFDSIDSRSRSFNLVRAKLLEMKAARQWRLIGIASATPNVGKSFIAANVAAALSRDPRFQTYAVDLDLRRGSLSESFGLVPEAGLGAYFEGQSATPESYRLEGEKLIVIPTAPGRIHSAELLAGERGQTFLRSMAASDERNIFIADLPPVFANDDAAMAMGRLDGYVIVAEEGKTKQREIDDVIGLLGDGRLAGVVLNKYRGGFVSEGYGVDSYYALGYSEAAAAADE